MLRFVKQIAVVAMAAIITAGCSVQSANPEAGTAQPSTPSPSAQARDGMVLVRAGSYPLGRDDGPDEERPAHRVTLKSFYVDAYPVTTQQFVDWANGQVGSLINARGGDPRRWDGPLHQLETDAVRDQTGREIFTTDDSDDDSRILRRDGRFAVEGRFGDHPVNEVYWWGAQLYCGARGARLLTEAEWEATARGEAGPRVSLGQ